MREPGQSVGVEATVLFASFEGDDIRELFFELVTRESFSLDDEEFVSRILDTGVLVEAFDPELDVAFGFLGCGLRGPG